MSIVAESYPYVMGVDTHAATHSYVIINAATAAVVAGPTKYPSTPAGIGRAIAWCQRRTDSQVLAAVEGTGSYGHTLTAALTAASIPVAEVRPPKRGGPKTDALDAESAARSVLRQSLDQLAQPRAGGFREALHIATGARHSLNKQRTADIQRLITLARRINLGIDARGELSIATITTIARWRAHPSDPIDIAVARGEATRLARRILATRAELADIEHQLHTLINDNVPAMLDLLGVGAITAAEILVSWSHKGRFATEARFAMHAGVAPIPVGSGKSDGTRVRLNPGNDRHLHSAIYRVAQTRMRFSQRTRDYVAKRQAQGHDLNTIRRAVERYCLRDIYRFLNTLDIPLTA